jgi:Tfp pilus assembly protein PilF
MVLEGGTRRAIGIRTDLPLLPSACDLEVSLDGGRTWEVIWPIIRMGDAKKLTGFMIPVPDKDSWSVYFRLKGTTLSGDAVRATSPEVRIEFGIPQVDITDFERDAGRTVEIRYRKSAEGISPLKTITLFYRPEGSHYWIFDREYEATGEAIYWQAPTEARYQFALVGTNELGMRGPDPMPGSVGQFAMDFGRVKDPIAGPPVRDRDTGEGSDGPVTAEDEMSIDELLTHADKAMGKSDFLGAVHYLRYASRREPENPKIWHRLGLAFQGTGVRPNAALDAFKRAVDRNGDHPEYRNDYGSALLLRGRYDEAIKEFQLAGDLPSARLNWGVALYHRGDSGDMEAAREKIDNPSVLQAEPALSRYYLASFFAREGEFDRAIELLEEALDASPVKSLELLLERQIELYDSRRNEIQRK